MFEVKNVEVVGMRQLVEGLRQAQGLHYTDSVQTHIEDPETLETAPHQFLLGDKDLKLIQGVLMEQGKNDNGSMYDIRSFVHIYMDIKADLKWWIDYAAWYNWFAAVITEGACFRKVCMSYADVHRMRETVLNKGKDGNPLTTSEKQFMDWTETLPYQELLTE